MKSVSEGERTVGRKKSEVESGSGSGVGPHWKLLTGAKGKLVRGGQPLFKVRQDARMMKCVWSPPFVMWVSHLSQRKSAVTETGLQFCIGISHPVVVSCRPAPSRWEQRGSDPAFRGARFSSLVIDHLV